MPHAIQQKSSPINPASQPVVWLLQGARLGDNQQVLALGAALEARFGWRLVVKQLKFHAGPVAGSDLAHAVDHVDFARSDSISATSGAGTADDPWPDLVVAIGRRMAPVARWIKVQNTSTGIHVQLGRFQDPFDAVDLLVTTAQYALPAGANVLHLSLPITARAPQRLADAAAAFAPHCAAIAGPLIGMLVGGPSNPIQFGVTDAQRLVREGLAFAQSRQGTLLVATSPRTPGPVLEVLRQGLPAPHRLFPFDAQVDARAGVGNPYLALLARGDAFIVTSDSVSMVADACLAGREVRLFDLPVTPFRPLWQPGWPFAQWVGRRRLGRLAQGKPVDFLDNWHDGEVRAARHQPTRHVPIIMNRLLRERHVALLLDPAAPRPGIDRLVLEELDVTTTRIQALLAERRGAHLAQGRIQGSPAVHSRPGTPLGSFDPVLP